MDELNELEIIELLDRRNEILNEPEYYDENELDNIDEQLKLLY